MKITHLLTLLLIPSTALAQSDALATAYRATPPVVPAEVTDAKVLVETVVPGGANGAKLTIRRIEPPVFVPTPPARAANAPAVTEEERAARRAAAPLEYRMFTPIITVYENGLSHLRWGVVDEQAGYQSYEAWSLTDLSSINACGDLDVGRRRYLLFTIMWKAGGRLGLPAYAPTAEAFNNSPGFILTKGNPDNAAALEPLIALHLKYAMEGAQIVSAAQAMKTRQAEAAAWEKANPVVPQDAIVSFWPVESTEYPANSEPAAK